MVFKISSPVLQLCIMYHRCLFPLNSLHFYTTVLLIKKYWVSSQVTKTYLINKVSAFTANHFHLGCLCASQGGTSMTLKKNKLKINASGIEVSQ